jgi:hypothetical protein
MLRNDRGTTWVYRTAECPACAELTVEIGRTDANGELVGSWLQVVTIGAPDNQTLAPRAGLPS